MDKKKNTKQQLIDLIDKLSENQIIYTYTFLSKLFMIPRESEKENR